MDRVLTSRAYRGPGEDAVSDPLLKTPSGKPSGRSLGIPFGGTPGRWSLHYRRSRPGGRVRDAHRGERRPDGRHGDPPAGFRRRGRCVRRRVSLAERERRDDWGLGEISAKSGTMAGPIAITNTHAVGVAHAAIVRWTAIHHPGLAEAWLLPVAAETWDGYLNDINGGHVTEEVGGPGTRGGGLGSDRRRIGRRRYRE